ncbi:MAG: AAA family ATPase [Chloroflexota bacterium]
MSEDSETRNGRFDSAQYRRYQLQEKIGVGGMGVVYRATDRLTGETVALKQVHLPEKLQTSDSLVPHATEDDLRLALAREFQILAGLRHPHIISVLDYGFDEAKRPFFTMTYLPQSQTILDAAKEAPFERKIELIQQLLQALVYLHRRGVLHRDLKPDNVLVVNGGVRLLDFGLSANELLGDEPIGTPLYLAPEIFLSEPHTPAAELFATGIIFYQMCTGVHPFAPFDYRFLERVLEDAPDLTRVDRRLRPFLTQLLAKLPNERFATASDALLALAKQLNQPRPPETAAIRESYLQAAKFVGRAAEMAQLTEALDQAANGSGSAWLIGGESGVGKTRLISELRTQALVSGFQVLRGQTVEDGGFPYEAWRVPVRQLVVTLPAVDDLTASVLLPLVPDIAALLNRPVAPAPELQEDAAQARLFTTIARLFWRAERPLLLILEDLHIAQTSLLPLPYLSRLVSAHKLLILGSYRSDERPGLPDDLADMTHLPLPSLSPAAMSDLSAAMLGDAGRDEAIQALLQRETEGNAFFAVEVVRELAEEAGRLGDIGQMKLPKTLLPNGIQSIVQRRVGKLPEKARQLLVKTAVAGRELELPLIHQLSEGLDVENEWLPLCADALILKLQDGVWQFSHGKIRDGLYATLSASQRTTLHREVALAIEHCCPDDEHHAAKLVYHWHLAQEPQKEQAYAWQAGQLAARQFANADAVAFFTQALRVTPADDIARQYEMMLALEKAYDITGQREESQTVLAQLTTLANQLADPQKQMAVMLRKVQLASTSSQFVQAEQLTDQAITFAHSHELYPQMARAHVLRAHVLLIQGQPEACEASLQAAQQLNQTTQDIEVELNILTIQRNLLEFKGNHRAALHIAEKRLALSRESGLKLQEGKSLMTLGLAHDKLLQHYQAQQYLEAGLALLVALGDRYSEGLCLLNLGNLFIRYGDYDAANNMLQTCLQVSREVNDSMNVGIALYNLGMVAIAQARYDEAREHIGASYQISQEIADREGDAYALTQLGKINRLQGAFAEARRCYLSALALRQAMEQPHFFPENQIGLAWVAAATGDDPQDYVEAVLAVIRDNPLIMGVDAPFEIYHDLIDYLKQSNHPQFLAVLAQAYQLLQKQAGRFADAAVRHSFLHNVPAHREIVVLFEQANGDVATGAGLDEDVRG